MNKLIAATVVAAALAAGTTTASAQYGYGYRGLSPAEAFARQAARDGRISKDEARIINRLRAQEYYGHQPPRRHWHRRWW